MGCGSNAKGGRCHCVRDKNWVCVGETLIWALDVVCKTQQKDSEKMWTWYGIQLRSVSTIGIRSRLWFSFYVESGIYEFPFAVLYALQLGEQH